MAGGQRRWKTWQKLLMVVVPLWIVALAISGIQNYRQCGEWSKDCDTVEQEQAAAESANEPVEPADEPDPDPPEPDAAAELACNHFSNIWRDVAAGVMSYEETREKFQEVYDDARISEIPGVATGAQKLLAGYTQQNVDEWSAGADELNEGCASVGMRAF